MGTLGIPEGCIRDFHRCGRAAEGMTAKPRWCHCLNYYGEAEVVSLSELCTRTDAVVGTEIRELRGRNSACTTRLSVGSASPGKKDPEG